MTRFDDGDHVTTYTVEIFNEGELLLALDETRHEHCALELICLHQTMLFGKVDANGVETGVLAIFGSVGGVLQERNEWRAWGVFHELSCMRIPSLS